MLGAHNDLTAIMSLHEELLRRNDVKILNEKLLTKEPQEIWLYEHVFYNKNTKTVRHRETMIALTDQEISLLELLLKNKNKLLSTQEIEYLLNPNKSLSNNAVSLIISRMKKKLPMIHLNNIYGQGYILHLEQQS